MGLAPCPVLVMRGGEGAGPPSRLVIGADSSGEARKAANSAAFLAGVLGAQVVPIIAYLNPMPVGRGRTSAYDAQVKRARGEAWEALSRPSAGDPASAPSTGPSSSRSLRPKGRAPR